MLKVYMTLFSCFRSILRSVRGLNKVLRTQKTVLIDAYNFCKEYISAYDFKLLTGISSKKINRWKNEILCNESFLSCPKQNPHQLSFEEQNTIVRALQNPENNHLFICDIWAKLLRSGQLSCKLSTFYKFSRTVTEKLGLRRSRIKKTVHRIVAGAPLTVLHVDCTVLRTDGGGRWYINIIYDNYSKAILGIKAMLTPNSFEVMQNLKEVVDEYHLYDKPFSLYCDGGPENKGYVDAFLSCFPLVKKFVNSISNGIHNNMIESFNSKFKRKLILALDLSRHENVPSQLPMLKEHYNHQFLALNKTLSPNEVLSGLVPGKDIFPELQNRISEAKNLRLMTNLMICCKD